jgi:tetratricopeptide (TPR) repeat protein
VTVRAGPPSLQPGLVAGSLTAPAPLGRMTGSMPRATLWISAGMLAALAACASGPDENEVIARDEFLRRGTQYFDVGRYVQAEQQARLGIGLDPEHAMLNLLAGRAILMQATLPKVAEARPFLETALELLETDRHKAHYSLAEYHLVYGRLLLAHVERERRALQQNPNPDPVAREQLGRDLDERETRARVHLRDADGYVKDALEEAPDSLQYLESQGQIAALRGEDEEAFAALGRALELLAESRAFLNRTLGFRTDLPAGEEERLRRRLLADIQREIAVRGVLAGLYKRQGRLVDEELEFTRMLQLDERIAGVYYSRGMVRYELGRIPEAAADMREFLMRTDLGPGAEQVAQAVDVLRELEKLQPSANG